MLLPSPFENASRCARDHNLSFRTRSIFLRGRSQSGCMGFRIEKSTQPQWVPLFFFRFFSKKLLRMILCLYSWSCLITCMGWIGLISHKQFSTPRSPPPLVQVIWHIVLLTAALRYSPTSWPISFCPFQARSFETITQVLYQTRISWKGL